MKRKILLLSIILIVSFKVSTSQIIYTIVGTGIGGYNGDGISAASAQVYFPDAITIDTAGNIYIADQTNFRIRKINPAGVITTIAGTGVYGLSGDGGPATSAMISGIYDVRLDRLGNIYLVDKDYNRIRKISTTGIITTVAGSSGPAGFSGDGGLATSAKLNGPAGVIIDSIGNIYIGDGTNNRIRKVNTSGIISTYAGTGVVGSLGDGGLASAAQFYAPGKMSFDKLGNLYIADNGNRKVRKITPAGIITTVAGTGGGGSSGDGGPATSATFTYPFGISVDSTGNLFIDDYSNRRVRKVNTSGIISTYAGNGGTGYSGDGGLATAAEISPQASTNDKFGNLIVADITNHCIRKIVSTCVAPSPPTSTTATLFACNGQTKTLSVSGVGLIKWYAFPTGGTVLGTGFNFTTPVLTADTTFYAEIKTCTTSTTRTAFPLTVYPIPSVTATSGSTICNGTSVTLNGGGASSYTWTGGISDGVAFYPSTSTTYTVTGTSSFGCTGTATSMITVNTPDPSYTASGAVLTANVSGAGYQWYNCTTSSTIAGATSQAYTIATGGSYALIITQTGCIDTSACQIITVTGIDNLSSNGFRIYPNPANDLLSVEFGASLKNEAIELKIYNTLGELVLSKTETTTNSKTSINISTLPAGAYFLSIYSPTYSFKTPLLIQH